MSRCLVTGGAGFIGSNLVERLVSLDESVVVIDNLSSGKIGNLESSMREGDVQFIELDITDREELETYMMGEQFDAVFHLAAVPRVQFSIANPHLSNEANVTGTLNMLLASKRQGIQRFIYSSSSSAYGNQDSLPLTEGMKPNPMSPYALQKLTGEQYAKMFHDLYGMETISLRYFNVFGPRQDPDGAYATLIPKFIELLISGKPAVINGDGEQTRDWTFVDDVVEANVLAAWPDNELAFGKTFNIGAGQNRSVNEVVQTICGAVAADPSLITHGPAVIEPRDTLASVELARQWLSWEPMVGFEEGLQRTAEYYLEMKV